METKENKPKDGQISLKQGKASIVWKGREVPFGVFFVVARMREAVRNSRQGFYTTRLRAIIRDLERGGMFAIPEAKKRLEGLAAGAKDINQQFVKMVCGWMGQLVMFRNVRTGVKENTNKAFRDNFDKIFAGG